MLLKYYKVDTNYAKFKSIIKRDELGRASIFDVAVAIKKVTSLNVEVDFFNYFYFDNSCNIKEELQKHLKNINDPNNRILASLNEALVDKVKINHKIFSIRELKELIIKGHPILTAVSVAELRGVKLNRWVGHFIVITGFDEDHFYFNDPHWSNEKFGAHRLEVSRMMAAIYRKKFPAILAVD